MASRNGEKGVLVLEISCNQLLVRMPCFGYSVVCFLALNHILERRLSALVFISLTTLALGVCLCTPILLDLRP